MTPPRLRHQRRRIWPTPRPVSRDRIWDDPVPLPIKAAGSAAFIVLALLLALPVLIYLGAFLGMAVAAVLGALL